MKLLFLILIILLIACPKKMDEPIHRIMVPRDLLFIDEESFDGLPEDDTAGEDLDLFNEESIEIDIK